MPQCQTRRGALTTRIVPKERRAHAAQPLVVLYVAIALSGFCALVGEVVWTRALALLFASTVYTFSIVLAVFLSGLGLGSVVGSVLVRGIGSPRIALGWCQLLVVGGVLVRGDAATDDSGK